MAIQRVSAEQARRRVATGHALLVCAYEDEAKCRRLQLENAVTLQELGGQLATLPRGQEIIFYCA